MSEHDKLLLNVFRRSATHVGGTKEYHLIVIRKMDADTLNIQGGVLIKRWGKKGAWGQVKVETYKDKFSLETAERLITNAKFSKEYSNPIRTPGSMDLTDWDLFKTHLGPQYWSILGEEAKDYLGFPEDVREAPKPGWEYKEGKLVESDFKPIRRERTPEEIQRLEDERMQRQMEINPNWGLY
jgi:predicted DNA-binding WGR domain protein